MGRDPIERPLSSLEINLFQRALYKIVQEEYSVNENYIEAEDAVGPITEDDIPND